MRGFLFLILGTIVFIAITFFEQIPILGWLGGVLSIAAWIALTRSMFEGDGFDVIGSGVGIVFAGIFGAVTGFVGALTAWGAQTGNLFGLTTEPGDRFGAVFGFLGASLGIVYWPIVGALVCIATAFLVAPSRSRM